MRCSSFLFRSLFITYLITLTLEEEIILFSKSLEMKVSLDPKICSNPDQSTRLLPKFFETHTIFQNLVLTSLYVTKFSVKRTIFFTLVVEKYMKKKPRCSKQILPVAFIISRFHCIVSRRDCLFLVLFTCVVLTPPPPHPKLHNLL